MQELSDKYMTWYHQLNNSIDGYSQYDAIAFYWLSIAFGCIIDGMDKNDAKEFYSEKVYGDACSLNNTNTQKANRIKHNKNHPGTPASAFGYKNPSQVKHTFCYHFDLFA